MDNTLSDFTLIAITAAVEGGKFLAPGGEKTEQNHQSKINQCRDQVSTLIREHYPQDHIDFSGALVDPGRVGAGVVWIIEPADGKNNLARNFPMWAVSIAAVMKGQVVAGIVYDPQRQEIFAAEKGKGAFLNGHKIRVSPTREIKDCLLTTGYYFYDYNLLQSYFSLLHKILPHIHGLRRYGSVAIDLCWIACGRLDGFLDPNLRVNEYAAGTLIVKEAGGKVTDWNGSDDYLYQKHIAASNGLIHKWILNNTVPILS